jgi:hypothetical protein
VSAPSQDFSSPPIRKTKRAVAWTIQRRLSRDCPTKFGLNHGAYMVNDQLFSAYFFNTICQQKTDRPSVFVRRRRQCLRSSRWSRCDHSSIRGHEKGRRHLCGLSLSGLQRRR